MALQIIVHHCHTHAVYCHKMTIVSWWSQPDEWRKALKVWGKEEVLAGNGGLLKVSL
jgi:hypothetical protein